METFFLIVDKVIILPTNSTEKANEIEENAKKKEIG